MRQRRSEPDVSSQTPNASGSANGVVCFIDSSTIRRLEGRSQLMSAILDMVRDVVGPEVMDRMNGIIGESPSATSKAFSAAVPTILAGAAQRAATPLGAEGLRSMIIEGGYGGGLLDSLSGRFDGADFVQGGSRILSRIFGSRTEQLTDCLASFAGIRHGPASSLLGLATPIVLSVLGRQITTQRLGGGELMSLLAAQKTAIESEIPSALASLLLPAREVRRTAAMVASVAGRGGRAQEYQNGIPAATPLG
jgi:hypothetical protein